ncbi:immunoglobulin-like domain-containing protein [Rummeliibacillus sp. POC4]|uniref:immunoglobulin-like domain-containing protein n=1 Tax=Rummeliibacillus sp. POC4 TaxID=2305899 RepID=UPI000E65EEDF|nr:immunoglobulin-like domain-containing protein [Rummeliibacillus sp. POC4]RIJ62917.1 DUF5011 domain-containing protein [Rummeliibacillus sp. POC4]
MKRKNSFNPLKGVKVIDEHDGNITDKLTVNTYKKGTYKLTYRVNDAAGNTATKTIKIRVK